MLDPATVTDRSTYPAGRTPAEGVGHVIVNGTLVLENGEPTRHPGLAPSAGVIVGQRAPGREQCTRVGEESGRFPLGSATPRCPGVVTITSAVTSELLILK